MYEYDLYTYSLAYILTFLLCDLIGQNFREKTSGAMVQKKADLKTKLKQNAIKRSKKVSQKIQF